MKLPKNYVAYLRIMEKRKGVSMYPFEDGRGHLWNKSKHTIGIQNPGSLYKCDRCGITMASRNAEKQCPKGPVELTYTFYDESSANVKPANKKCYAKK